MEENRKDTKLSLSLYLMIFGVCLITLMYEITLSRLFSVTLFYHFAFLVISLALFGTGLGGLIVYFSPKYFSGNILEHSLRLIVGLAFSIFLNLIVSTNISTSFANPFGFFSVETLKLFVLFLSAALPFFYSGSIIALLFTRFPHLAPTIYFFDLLGAAVGCLLVMLLLQWLGAPSVLILLSGLAMIPATIVALRLKYRRAYILLFIFLGSIALAVINPKFHWLDIHYVRGLPFLRGSILFEKWNSFSYITVSELPNLCQWLGWGTSTKFKGKLPPQLSLTIDLGAFTVLTKFDGDWNKVAHLRYESCNIIYRIKNEPTVLIIGAGGGKDILAALYFKAKDVDAVEINPIIVKDVVGGKFAEFTGNPYMMPGVNSYICDGRYFIQHTNKKYDIIILTMVDTYAATAAGAYALTENSLYTVEALQDFLKSLTDDGVISIGYIDSIYLKGGTRTVTLAIEALRRSGIVNYGEHLFIIRVPADIKKREYFLTTLIKRSPFTSSEIKTLLQTCDNLGFEILYYPGRTIKDSLISILLNYPYPEQIWQNFDIDISPVTDNRPFFFYQNRLKDTLSFLWGMPQRQLQGNGLFILIKVITITIILVLAFYLLPLLFRRDLLSGSSWKDNSWFLLYFSMLGLGFMFLEVLLIQRWSLVIGNPIYTLSIILFSLLIFTGAGSYLTNFIIASHKRLLFTPYIIFILYMLIILQPFIFPYLQFFFLKQERWLIHLGVILTLLPLGLLLGVPFPLGIKLAGETNQRMIPWMWGINGATSIMGSVFAVFFAIHFGFNLANVIPALCYFIAFLSLSKILKEKNKGRN